MRDGLAGNGVSHIAQTPDDRLWFAGQDGVSRYDGQNWVSWRADDGARMGWIFPVIHPTRDGGVWIDDSSGTVLYYPPESGRNSPETTIGLAVDRVQSDGNTVVRWSGRDRWDATSPDEMRYRWRLDDGDWSAWSRRSDVTFTNLPIGDHRFEVQSQNKMRAIDETPAVHAFTVLPPWWQNPVLAIPGALLLLFALFQTGRVIRSEGKLRQSVSALPAANDELFAANREIQEQTERKSAFLASMSHELRTPMNAIKGFTSLVLRREPNLTDRGKGNLEKVSQASDHLLGQINDVLDLSKIEAGKMDVNATTFEVEKLIASCASTVSPLVKDGVNMNYDVDGVGEAHSDEARLRQMLINLLSNAIKFTDRGEVRVSATRKPSSDAPSPGSQITDSSSSAADLVISVSDTGKGISAEELPSIFDEFRQVGESDSTVQRGTGLGLSISKKFAELLGGTIEVESEIGKGSTFTIVIPSSYSA